MPNTNKFSSRLASSFEALVEASSTSPAVLEIDREWSREEIRQLSTRVTELLDGMAPGSIVAFRLRNSALLVASVLALLRSGHTILPIDRDAKNVEVERITSAFGASALLTEGSPVTLEPLSNSARVAIPEGTAMIKLTSGSTGQPRGVATSEQNLLADARSICLDMQIGAGDVSFGAIPLSHSYGFSNLVTPLLMQGTAIVASNDYLPLSMISLANRTRCTVLPGVPMMFDLLANLPRGDGTFETVRTFVSAGAPLRESTARIFNQRHGAQIRTFYGCSECGGISYDRLGGATSRGTVGKPMSGVGIEVDERGRLVVSGDSVALGYVNASEQEAGMLGGGVFRAEDLIEITDGGEIRILGRASDLINVAGRKVNPREIENVILEMEEVRDVRVSGFDGGARGDVVAAVIEATGLTKAAVRDFCAARLASHKLPRRITIVDELPRDQRGKVRQADLRRLGGEPSLD